MLRELLSLRNDAVRELVGVLALPLAALLTFGPTAEFGVLSGSLGLSLRLHAAEQRANVYFVSTMRAFHRPQNTTLDAYDA